MVSGLIDDLRHVLRSIRRRPRFALLAMATLGVGIGANVSGFVFLGYYLWPSLEAPRPGAVDWLTTGTADDPRADNSLPDLRDLERALRDERRVFDRVAGFRLLGISLTVSDRPLHAWAHAVTGDYFPLFGARAEAGRLLGPADDRSGAPDVLVLSHDFWRRHFAADPAAIGAVVMVNGEFPYTVVGILPPGFQGQGFATGAYLPLERAGRLLARRDLRDARIVPALVRRAPGTSRESALAALSSFARALDAAHPGTEKRRMGLRSALEADPSELTSDPYLVAAKALMLAVLLLLLLACANVANLFLARTLERRRELAIHVALGGGARIARRVLLESGLLAAGGAACGLLVARAGVSLIEGYLIHSVPVGFGEWSNYSHLAIDRSRLLGFVALVCGATALLFGALPALYAARIHVASALKGEAAGRLRRYLGARSLLVVAQVALSVVLLLGAALLVRTLVSVRAATLGFEPRGLYLAAFFVPPAPPGGGPADGSLPSVAARILERVRALGGVRTASLTSVVPVGFETPVVRAGTAASADRSGWSEVPMTVVADAFFDTLRIGLLAGRDFGPRDHASAGAVAVVNQAAARALFGGGGVLGRSVYLEIDGREAPARGFEVVGVVADSRHERVTAPIRPLIYLYHEQLARTRLTLVIRAASAAGPVPKLALGASPHAELGASLRALLGSEFPGVAAIDLVPFDEQLRRSRIDQRMNSDLASGFAVLGLLLAALGIFSVVSYSVARRGREFAIRAAVGARGRDLSRLVIGESARLVAAGLLAGVAGALALGRVVRGLLYGVSSADPLAFGVVLVVLAAVTFAAALAPARAAARVTPQRALRQD